MKVVVRVSQETSPLGTLWQDIRFGARVLLRSPGTTGAILFALTLGIGANSAMFSLVDAVALRPLPFRDPSSLVVIWDKDSRGVLRNTSAGNFRDWRTHTASFSEIAGWSPESFVLTGLDRPQQIQGASVTANFFRTLGVQPVQGRTFLPDEDGMDNPANAAKTAVIGYQLWQDSFAGSPNVIGKELVLDRNAYAIVGVLPESFEFRVPRHQVWIPATVDRVNREYRYITGVGRLRTSRTAASTEMAALAVALAQAYPKANKNRTIQVDDLQEWLVVSRSFKTRVIILFIAVAVVLLIACTNVASLLLARATARNREIALRTALGASRGRLMRQLLTESVLLSVVGGVLGLGLAWLLIHAAPSILPPNLMPATVSLELSSGVVFFTLAVAVLTGILFGIAPAVVATQGDVQETLQDSSRGSTGGRGGQRFRQAMVMVEVAMALVLLAGASLMLRSLNALSAIDLGFSPKNVLSMRLFLPPANYGADAALRLHEQLLQKISAFPGVQNATVSSNLPLARITMDVPWDLPDAPPHSFAERPGAGYVSVTPGYLNTLGLLLRRGRFFGESDRDNAPPVVIINDALASRYFPGQDPVGQRIILNRPILGQNNFAPDIRAEVVGLVGNVKLNDLGAPPRPMIYVPQAQNVWSAVSWLAVRTTLSPTGLTSAIRRAMAELDKNQPVEQVEAMEDTFGNQFAQPRFQSEVMGAFAGLALVLAVVGIYGVNAYAVSQRRREIGVRMALGASPERVWAEVILAGLKLTGAGVVLGLVSALALGPALRSVIVGIEASDPFTLAAVALFLTIVAVAASFIPAQRATRVDPAIALRHD